MGKIPADATHWDGGDWINWHRRAESLDAECTDASQDDSARLTALHVSLLSAARGYYLLTGEHLPLYPTIARVHAALNFGVPLTPDMGESSVQVAYIPPHGPTNMVEIDLTAACTHVLVVRIKDNFSTEARMTARAALPDSAQEPFMISWSALPLPR
jgi:hypothetical protein